MQHKKFRVLAIVGGLLAGGFMAGTVQAAGGVTEAMLSNTCAGCHGTNGAAAGPSIPSIANMDAKIMVSMMKQFADGSRPATIMDRVAKGYSDEELHKIGAFFAKTPWVAAKGATDAAMVKQGAKLHKKQKCKGCHEENGASQDAEENMVRIAGQHAGALYIMMKNYQSKEFPNAPGKMVKRLKKMKDADLHALAQFYASQK